MANEDFREAQQQARQHGLKARHELRLERALDRPCDCDLARSEPLDHKPGPHHQASCPRWLPDLENATYTAAEVKVLTEAALRLGEIEGQAKCAAFLEKRACLRAMRGTETGAMLLRLADDIRNMSLLGGPSV